MRPRIIMSLMAGMCMVFGAILVAGRHCSVSSALSR